MGEAPGYDELLQLIRVRDEQDRTRAIAPLKPAPDAVIVDTTELDQDQVFEVMIEAIKSEQ
jgi:CMP/dCMP kinase